MSGGRAAIVSAVSVDGDQCFGTFSGGNTREQTNFGCRLEMVSHELEYSILLRTTKCKETAIKA